MSGAAGQTESKDTANQPLPSEGRIIAATWPILLASSIGLLPFTIFSAFLVPISDAAGQSEALVGSLRALGGIGAVVVGVLIAPLLGWIAPARIAALALVILAVASLTGTISALPTLIAFCLLTGISNSMLYPALSAAAADRFGDGPAASRAATLVMTAQTLAATLGGPLLVLPTLWWGWQGNFVAVAVLAVALAVLLLGLGRKEERDVERPQRLRYIETFKTLAKIPGALALLLVAFARAGAFMGYLAFLAPLYTDRFGLEATTIAFIWGLSGGSFFLGHLLAGRLLNAEDSDRKAQRVMVVSLAVALGSLILIYSTPWLPLALLATVLLSVCHSVVAAAVTTLLVRRCGPFRGAALSLNSAGMSLGLFLGTGLAGVGLASAGYLGMALALGALNLIALLAACSVRTTSSAASPAEATP